MFVQTCVGCQVTEARALALSAGQSRQLFVESVGCGPEASHALSNEELTHSADARIERRDRERQVAAEREAELRINFCRVCGDTQQRQRHQFRKARVSPARARSLTAVSR